MIKEKTWPREIIVSNKEGISFSTSWYTVEPQVGFDIIENEALIAAKRAGKSWVEAILILEEEGYPQDVVDNLWGQAWNDCIIATVNGPYYLLEIDGVEWALERDKINWRH